MLNNANFFNKVPHRGLCPLIPATEPESHKIADQVRDEVNGSAMRFAKRFSSEARFLGFLFIPHSGLYSLIPASEPESVEIADQVRDEGFKSK